MLVAHKVLCGSTSDHFLIMATTSTAGGAFSTNRRMQMVVDIFGHNLHVPRIDTKLALALVVQIVLGWDWPNHPLVELSMTQPSPR
jgi:hypothetical protein